jgi:TRAP-type C4-dicarboxylate transport system permease small subunit
MDSFGMDSFGSILRRWLDRLYDLCGAIAALCLVTLLIVISLQMAARWSGQQFPGSTSYAGYCMAAASFFALAHTLNRGGHIRVSLLLSQLGRHRRLGEIWCFGIGSILSVFLAVYAIKAVQISIKLHDISQGQDATPIWIPQLPMAIGAALFAIAMIDRLIRILAGASYQLGGEDSVKEIGAE